MPNARSGRRCAETTKDGLPCPADPLKRPDPDARYRCPQHTQDPVIQQRVILSRQVAGLVSSRSAVPVVSTERYETRESLDRVIDETINTLRAELTRRRDGKAALANAIFAGVEAKLKLAQLEVVARMLAQMKGRAVAGEMAG
jgi:hypothetical protein